LGLINITEAEIARRLAVANPEYTQKAVVEFPDLDEYVNGIGRSAAVLIPLLQKRNTWHVLFTRRNAFLAEHSGQVAFPGGQSDINDQTPEQTALREALEEIGLQPRDVHLVGRLPIYLTITNFLVTPIVGIIPWPYPFTPKVDEVSRIFTIPLYWLAKPTNHELHQRDLPAPHRPVSVVYFKLYDGELLWGASARFTLALLNALQLT
jgi:8-oxo-dGTP pyrophosphatase MutT (NUDIX family)